MDVINKLYSSVQTTVSQFSGVLPGNNVTREYEILQQIGNAGLGLQWKVYSGYKKTTKQEVSVFVFEKKKLEKWPKDDRDSFLNILRHGVQQLTKIKHPRVLTVQHPLEESRDSLAFATEPVIASLSNILEDVAHTKLFDVEIIHGFQQLIDGLLFLHSDANIVHGNICPGSVLINKHRSWKIYGFDFSVIKNSANEKFNGVTNPSILPSLDYLAPEKVTADLNIAESDLYSLGMLMYCIYSEKPFVNFDNSIYAFKQYATQTSHNKYPEMDKVPHDLRNILSGMVHRNPDCRPKLIDLIQIQHFQDVGVETLNYLDTLYQWDNLQKSKFFKGLLRLIPNFPHPVNIHTVIPYLVNEFVNLPMIPFVLPNILLIAKMSSPKEYSDHILPHLKSVFTIDEPIQILLILMQEIEVLLKLTPANEVQSYVLPLLIRSLDSEIVDLQELCLQILPSVTSKVDYSAVKNSLVPRVKKRCLNSSDISIKVKCLICIGKLLEYLDKWVLLSDILPFLEQIQNREPAIIMAIIGIYRIALADAKLGITVEVMATKCIPFLMPLCVENNLSVAQFSAITAILKDMFQQIESEQRMKLEKLSTTKRDYRTPSDHKPALLSLTLPNSNVNTIPTSSVTEKVFKNGAHAVRDDVTHTNPLVITRQLTTPVLNSNNTFNNKYTSQPPPINYIYPSHYSLIDSNNKMTRSVDVSSNKNNTENSKLIPLSQQDILNFLN